MKLLSSLVGIAVAALAGVAIAKWLDDRKKRSLVSPYNPPEQAYKPVVDITV